jgi:hypothetical protein
MNKPCSGGVGKARARGLKAFPISVGEPRESGIGRKVAMGDRGRRRRGRIMAERREPGAARVDSVEGESDDRATLLPSFDMQQYARESDESIRTEDEAPTRPRGALHSAVYDVSPSVEVSEAVTDAEAQEIYWARIGDGAQVPVLARPIEDLLREPRDAGEGFVLSAIDGKSTVHSLVASCALPAVAVLRALCELVDRGAVGFVQPAP